MGGQGPSKGGAQMESMGEHTRTHGRTHVQTRTHMRTNTHTLTQTQAYLVGAGAGVH